MSKHKKVARCTHLLNVLCTVNFINQNLPKTITSAIEVNLSDHFVEFFFNSLVVCCTSPNGKESQMLHKSIVQNNKKLRFTHNWQSEVCLCGKYPADCAKNIYMVINFQWACDRNPNLVSIAKQLMNIFIDSTICLLGFMPCWTKDEKIGKSQN